MAEISLIPKEIHYGSYQDNNENTNSPPNPSKRVEFGKQDESSDMAAISQYDQARLLSDKILTRNLDNTHAIKNDYMKC